MPFKPTYEVPEQRRAYTLCAETQLVENANVGCLMLHGFMGSPTSSRPMAEYLAAHGISVHCPLLPGHGNLPEMIVNVTTHDWIAEAEEALAHLRTMADQIFILGHSMGAVLGAYLIEKNPDLQGMVMLAPLYNVPDWRIRLSGVVKLFMPWFYPLKRKDVDRHIFLGRVTDFDPTIDVEDPSLQAWLVERTRIPLAGVWEMVKMARLGRRLWRRLQTPAMILQGEEDPAATPENARQIFALLPHADKALHLFPKTGHELMRPFSAVHQQVWQLIHQFIRERTGVVSRMP